MPPDTQGLPWPEGEPEPARAAARRAAGLSSALRGIQGGVAATDAPGWTGTAAGAFDGAVQRDAAAVGAAAGAFDEAAGALTELAGRVEAAQERVLEASRRLRDAREAARAAADRAIDARSAATSAHAAAALDPTSVFASPLLAEASAAEDAALRAEAASAMAQDELARVERWARREAEDAVRDAERADERTAGELEAASAGMLGFAPGLVPTAAPAGGGAVGAMASGGPLSHLGGYLRGDLLNYWAGGSDRSTIPLGKLAQAGAMMYGTARWLPQWYAHQSWVRAAPGSPLAMHMRALMYERLPTFNNGLLGRGLSRGLSAVPQTAGAGSWLSNASKATPVFRGLGIAGGGVSTVLDAHHVISQGNPVDAFERDGAGYVADVGRLGFSASTTAFLIAPNPVTGGAVLVTGAVWAGAEAWQHREAIAGAVADGAEFVWDHSLVGATWNNREEIGAAIDSGINTAQEFAADVGGRLDQGIDTIGSGLSDAGGDLVDAGGDVLEDAGDVVEDLTPW